MIVNAESKVKFQELKLDKKHRYIIYKIDEEREEVIVEKIGERSTSYDDFEANLPPDECRYAVFEYDIPNSEENVPSSKIFIILWSPETSKPRSKMVYSSSMESLIRALQGQHGFKHKLTVTEPIEMRIILSVPE